MIGTLLDPNMCLSGPKRPFGGPKIDKIQILGPKKVCFDFGGLNIAKLIYYLVWTFEETGRSLKITKSKEATDDQIVNNCVTSVLRAV